MHDRPTRRARLVGLVAAAGMLAALLPASTVLAVGYTVTPATGGTGISTTTAATGGSGAWTTISGPLLSESAGGELLNTTLSLSLPAGFEFNPNITSAPVLSGTSCTNTATALVYSGTGNSSTSVMTKTGAANTGACTIQFKGLQIRPLTTTPASGDITLNVNEATYGPAGAVSSVAPPPPSGRLTLTITSPTMNNSAIIWGQSYIDIKTSGAPGTSFQIQASTDNATWTPLKNSSGAVLTWTIGSSGYSTYRYTPIRNYWYKSVAGSTVSNVVRITVRQTCSISPSHSGTVTLVAGSKITFTTTSRPARSDLPTANVKFEIWQQSSSGSWVLHSSVMKPINSSGQVSWPVTFSTKGSFYVRAQTQPTSVNSNSFWTPNQYYTIN